MMEKPEPELSKTEQIIVKVLRAGVIIFICYTFYELFLGKIGS